MNGCDRQAVDRYANGLATPVEMNAIEGHLLTCSACEAYLDELLSRVASTVVIDQRPAPLSVRRQVFKERTRVPRLVWGLGFAVILVALLIFSRPTLAATSLTCMVRNDGRSVAPGSSIGSGSELTLTGPGSISFGELTVASRAPFNRFGIVKDGNRWRIKDPLFPVDLVHRGGKLAYGAQTGSLKLDPAGTRFRVWHNGFEVYASEVLATNASGTKTECLAGRRYVAGRLEPIDDDPTRFMDERLDLPASLTSWVQTVSSSYETGPSPEALSEIRRLDVGAPGTLSRLSVILARDLDADACAQVLGRAIEFEPSLGSLDDAQFDELISFLVGFGEDSGLVARLARARGWMSWEDLAANSLPRRIKTARSHASTAGSSSARLALVSAAVRAAIKSQVATGGHGLDTETLRWAQLEVPKVLADGRLSRRGRAAALGVLAEAQYYLPETEMASLDALRKSVALWRTPERVAHLCARVSEISTPTARDRSDLVQAFAANPTYRSAERVLTFLRDNAATPRDRDVLLEFAHWIGDHYRTVPNAQAVVAEHLMDRSAVEALRYFEQAERLVDGRWSELDVQHGEAFAIALWRVGGYKSRDRRAAQSIAERCGLNDPKGHRFFLEAGLFDDAIGRLTRSAGASEARIAERGRILREAGRSVEAAAAYQRFLDTSGGAPNTLATFDAAISIAELVRSSTPRRSAELAQRVLRADVSVIERGWRRHRRYGSLYRARAHWMLGDRSRAITGLEDFLEGSASEEAKRPERTRLRLWRAEATASPASRRSSESRRTR